MWYGLVCAIGMRVYINTSSNARLRPGNSLITQSIDLQTLFSINDRQTGQTDRQTGRLYR